MSEKAARIRRRIVWPSVLALLIGSAGFSVAEAYNQELPERAPLTAEWSAPDTVPALGEVAAPEPTAAPAPNTPNIEVILPPPPPPPPAPSSGRRSGSGSSGGSSGGGSYPLLDAVNAERAAVGLGALSWSQSLANGSASWSGQMCSDQDANSGLAFGSGDWYAAVFRHSSGGGYGENIYAAYGADMSLGAAHNAWMNSSGHRANILGSGYTQFGVASCMSAGGVYFATERFS